MQPKTILNQKLNDKLASYLVGKEGHTLVSQEDTAEGHKVTLRDAFGFIFTIEVKTIGRVAMNEVLETPEDKPLLERVI